MSVTSQLEANLRRIRERIQAACVRVGRDPDTVTLVAVTKYAELDWVRALVDLGFTDLGESRPQQLVSRAEQLSPLVRWHMIGHLQRNKVESLLPACDRIHSADSLRLIEAISKGGQKLGLSARVLIEVNISGEQSKDGFNPDQLQAAWPAICHMESISVEGLMTMAPLNNDVESSRPVFRALCELRDRLADASGGKHTLPDLSMGMSGDFEIGIEEGATLLRVGSSLFQGLATG